MHCGLIIAQQQLCNHCAKMPGHRGMLRRAISAASGAIRSEQGGNGTSCLEGTCSVMKEDSTREQFYHSVVTSLHHQALYCWRNCALSPALIDHSIGHLHQTLHSSTEFGHSESVSSPDSQHITMHTTKLSPSQGWLYRLQQVTGRHPMQWKHNRRSLPGPAYCERRTPGIKAPEL